MNKNGCVDGFEIVMMLLVMTVIFFVGLGIGNIVTEGKFKTMAVKEGLGHYTCDNEGHVSFVWGISTNK